MCRRQWPRCEQMLWRDFKSVKLEDPYGKTVLSIRKNPAIEALT
jgi:hypothetical protein